MIVDRFAGVDQHTQQFAGFLKPILAFLHGRESPAVGFVLAFVPARTDRQREAALTRGVDGTSDLGNQRRVAVGIAEHQVAQSQFPRHAADEGNADRPSKAVSASCSQVRTRWDEVVSEPDAVPVASLHGLHRCPHGVPRRAVDVHLYPEIQGFSPLAVVAQIAQPQVNDQRPRAQSPIPYAERGAGVQRHADWMTLWTPVASLPQFGFEFRDAAQSRRSFSLLPVPASRPPP